MNNKVFITSDLHLGHSNIIQYCNRPYEDVNEMNEDLIRRWNETVTDSDRVFFLGDFGLASKEKIIEWGNRLRGRKVMIYGNHDHYKPEIYYEAGFEYVSKWPIMIQNKYLLSHAPISSIDGGSINCGKLINLYGHIHDKVDQWPTISTTAACVCVERWDYRPVDLSKLARMITECRK